MDKQTIIFNLDDTLIHCNKYFNAAIAQFAERMSEWFDGVTVYAAKEKQLELDLISVQKNGLTIEHFPQSFVDVYRYYAKERGQEPEADRIKQLTELGYSVFETPVEPLPDLYLTLERLKHEGHDLYVHTGGDERNQLRKIAQLELGVYFETRIFVSLHKDTEALRKMLDSIQPDIRNTWMVGNSVRTDIIPGLELGVNTIYIPAESEWQYNVLDITIEPKAAYMTLDTLKEVPGAIYTYLLTREADEDRGKLPYRDVETAAWDYTPL
ncbi:HAD family hydrolase [Paenibacillus sp. YYML68]|uniref:HAD family hydrolase n=1 Tax=Paenibacillus sp. YYML68 TaxID=2909250 RepID=UPI002492D192|nr:HAD family hydrolase [Paenibacillus sp. YYML68]